MKKYKSGLVLGKFHGLHLGHLYLIESAVSKCDMVYVMICSLKNEEINGIIRYNWLKMIFEEYNNIKIIYCSDENPQKPNECKSTDVFYNSYWVPSVYSRIDYLDVVFTSENYGDEFAKYLGIEHELIDLNRTKYPISGTLLRSDPFKYWDYIPDIAKPYFTKRILIMGPESTGKTTLIKKLAKHYNVEYVEEYGRTYTETIKPGKELTTDDFYEIASHHDNDILDAHYNTKNKYLFIDTDAVTTKLFGELYIDGYYDYRVNEIIEYQWFDIIFVMDIDVNWVDDGTRDFPNDRKKHLNKIESELYKLNRKYHLINGNYDERFSKIEKIISLC